MAGHKGTVLLCPATFSGADIIGEITNDNYYVYYRGTELLGSKSYAGNINFYRLDGHGSVTAVLSPTGEEIKTYNYDAFGAKKAFVTIKVFFSTKKCRSEMLRHFCLFLKITKSDAVKMATDVFGIFLCAVILGGKVFVAFAGEYLYKKSLYPEKRKKIRVLLQSRENVFHGFSSRKGDGESFFYFINHRIFSLHSLRGCNHCVVAVDTTAHSLLCDGKHSFVRLALSKPIFSKLNYFVAESFHTHFIKLGIDVAPVKLVLEMLHKQKDVDYRSDAHTAGCIVLGVVSKLEDEKVLI